MYATVQAAALWQIASRHAVSGATGDPLFSTLTPMEIAYLNTRAGDGSYPQCRMFQEQR
jgi:hypothetical protein